MSGWLIGVRLAADKQHKNDVLIILWLYLDQRRVIQEDHPGSALASFISMKIADKSDEEPVQDSAQILSISSLLGNADSHRELVA
jgi:hypothetical protein